MQPLNSGIVWISKSVVRERTISVKLANYIFAQLALHKLMNVKCNNV